MEPYLIISILLFGAAAAAFPAKKKPEKKDAPKEGLRVRLKGINDYNLIIADIPNMPDKFFRINSIIRIAGLPELGSDPVSEYRKSSIQKQLESRLFAGERIEIRKARPDKSVFGLVADLVIDGRSFRDMVYDHKPVAPAVNMAAFPRYGGGKEDEREKRFH